MSKGIDYGMGKTNVDTTNGIRYGVISVHEVTQAWCDSSEPDYGEPHCPKCGNKVEDNDHESYQDYSSEEWYKHNRDHCCGDCEYCFNSDESYGDDPLRHTLDDGEYQATQGGDDTDIFIIKSPYYTICEYCSPCAPGAGYIINSVDDGIRAYCFGHDWFDDGKAPYPVYSVATGELVSA